jgi:hypothetical protein
MEKFSQLLIPAIGFIVTLVFGFWLSRRGKPYNGLLFNVHKLIALGTVILSGLAVSRALKLLDPESMFYLSLGIAAINVIALFASGALMSAGKGEYRKMKLIHNVAPFFAFLGMAFAAYLLE